MSKIKMVNFPFRDGNKYIKEGDTVVVTDMNRKSDGFVLTVKKIGRTLITLSNNTKWYIETGRLKSNYSNHNNIYSSPEARDEMAEFSKKKEVVRRFFDWQNNSKHSPEIINQVYEIIKEASNV